MPCANVPHVVDELRRLGAQRITDAMVYKLTRDGGEGCRAARLLPASVTVHKLTAAERWERPMFRVTRTYEIADGSDGAAAGSGSASISSSSLTTSLSLDSDSATGSSACTFAFRDLRFTRLVSLYSIIQLVSI